MYKQWLTLNKKYNKIFNKRDLEMKKDEVLNKINELLEKDFIQFGFHSNRNKSTYNKKDGFFTFKFNIHVTPKIWQHLNLSVDNKEIEKIFMEIETKTLNEYNRGNRSIGKMPICVLTDWKRLYMDNNLDIGKIWFTSISDFEEIINKKDEYLLAIKLSTQWFEKCKDLDFVYRSNLNRRSTKTIEMALCIGKIIGKDLNYEYEKFIKENGKLLGWDKEEVDIFFKYIKNYE
jgi:hypothetical protein